MGLVLKYVIRTKTGTWHYRRRFPKAVVNAVGKGEFKRFLGDSEREALRAYPKIHAQFERLVSEARAKSARRNGPLTAMGVHNLAEERAAELAQERITIGGRAMLAGEDGEAAVLLRDSYFSQFPVDPETGEPVGIDAVEGRALSILTSGGRLERPDPTLEDARKLYLKEKIGDDRKKKLELDRIFKLVREALQRDRTLESLKRRDAREVRDHMADGRKASSVDRYLNVVRAVINHALREFDLSDVVNPFLNLEAAPDDNGSSDPDRDKRRSFTEDELSATTTRILSHARPDLRLIWQILEGTGCRLAEVTGLRVADVHLDHSIPHIAVTWHDDRRIKNKVSRRDVPLIGAALVAARMALRDVKEGQTMLFPAYGRKGGPASASAALGKHVRAVVSDPKVVTHSLRHTMKDRLRLAGVQKSEQDILLGHSSGDVGETYGGDPVRLATAERALKAALEIG